MSESFKYELLIVLLSSARIYTYTHIPTFSYYDNLSYYGSTLQRLVGGCNVCETEKTCVWPNGENLREKHFQNFKKYLIMTRGTFEKNSWSHKKGYLPRKRFGSRIMPMAPLTLEHLQIQKLLTNCQTFRGVRTALQNRHPTVDR